MRTAVVVVLLGCARAPHATESKVSNSDAKPTSVRPSTTPAEIETALGQALDGNRSDEAVRYCGMLDPLSDPHLLLGCTLAACREKDASRARRWAANLDKKLRGGAVKPCAQSGITLE